MGVSFPLRRPGGWNARGFASLALAASRTLPQRHGEGRLLALLSAWSGSVPY